MPRRRAGVLLPLELEILGHGIEIQDAEGSFYGFSLARRIAAQSARSLTAYGTLYKALARMTESGLLTAKWEEAEAEEAEGRPRRRLYTVTATGAAALLASEAALRSNGRLALDTPLKMVSPA
jgi:PadR family transcriptional regulator PadR